MPNTIEAVDQRPGDVTELPFQREFHSPVGPLADQDDDLEVLFEAPEPAAETRATGTMAWARSDRLAPATKLSTTPTAASAFDVIVPPKKSATTAPFDPPEIKRILGTACRHRGVLRQKLLSQNNFR